MARAREWRALAVSGSGGARPCRGCCRCSSRSWRPSGQGPQHSRCRRCRAAGCLGCCLRQLALLLLQGQARQGLWQRLVVVVVKERPSCNKRNRKQEQHLRGTKKRQLQGMQALANAYRWAVDEQARREACCAVPLNEGQLSLSNPQYVSFPPSTLPQLTHWLLGEPLLDGGLRHRNVDAGVWP